MWLACGIWVRTLTGDDAAAGLTVLFFTLPSLLAPLAGLLVDRVRRSRLLLVANLLGVVVVAPLLLVRGRGQVWLIFTVMVLSGLLTVVLAPAQSALLAGLLPADLLVDANAVLRTAQEGLKIVAPVAGAGLFVLVGGRAVAALDMLTFLAAAAFVAALRYDEPRPAPTPLVRGAGRAWRAVSAGFRFLRAEPALRRLTVASACATVAVGFSFAVAYAVVGQGLHRSASFVGVTQTVQGAGAIAGGLTAAAAIRRVGEPRVAVGGLLLFAAGPVLLSTSSLAAVVAGSAVTGAAVPWIVIAVVTLLQRLSPHRLQGRVYAAFEVATAGPQALGIAVGAALISAISYRYVLAAEVVILLLAATLLLRADESRVGKADVP